MPRCICHVFDGPTGRALRISSWDVFPTSGTPGVPSVGRRFVGVFFRWASSPAGSGSQKRGGCAVLVRLGRKLPNANLGGQSIWSCTRGKKDVSRRAIGHLYRILAWHKARQVNRQIASMSSIRGRHGFSVACHLARLSRRAATRQARSARGCGSRWRRGVLRSPGPGPSGSGSSCSPTACSAWGSRASRRSASATWTRSSGPFSRFASSASRADPDPPGAFHAFLTSDATPFKSRRAYRGHRSPP